MEIRAVGGLVEAGYRWKPIEDLPSDWQSLSDGEFQGLVEFWKDQQADARTRGVLDEVMNRLKREWAVETGAIEGVYALERGVTQTLIERGIEAALIPHGSARRSPEWVAQVIRDQQDVLEHLFDFVASRRPLTESYIKETHAALMRNQTTRDAVDTQGRVVELPLRAGVYKNFPNHPTRPDGRVHEYCPPLQVAPEMEHLVAWHQQHFEARVGAEVEAAWLHHAFTQIHPFEDGNGRVARALATIVLLRAGGFPMTVRNGQKGAYLDALEAADTGRLREFVRLVLQAQRTAAITATVAIGEVATSAALLPELTDQSVESLIASTKAALLAKGLLSPAEWQRSTETADGLATRCVWKLEELTQKMNSEIGTPTGRFSFAATSNTNQGITSRMSFPISTDWWRSATFRLLSERSDELHFAFATVGKRFRGLVAVEAFWNEDALPLDIFQINYCEPPGAIAARFETWMDRALVLALQRWQASLQ